MSLKQRIEEKLNEALKAKNKDAYPTLRLIISAIKIQKLLGVQKDKKILMTVI